MRTTANSSGANALRERLKKSGNIIASGQVTGFGEYNAIVGMKELTDMEAKFKVDIFKQEHDREVR